MKFADRNVVVSSVDPVPRSMRVSSSVLVVTRDEALKLAEGDKQTIAALSQAIDEYELKALRRHMKLIGGFR